MVIEYYTKYSNGIQSSVLRKSDLMHAINTN